MSGAALGGSGFRTFATDRPSAIVVSHERSGTHFLMNTLARAYGYISSPWVNFDSASRSMNYFHPPSVAAFLEGLGRQRLANVVKSHHSAEFFDGILPRLKKHYAIFYIHRNPVDVMISQWRWFASMSWREGPSREKPHLMALAEPEGAMLRYQMHQRPTVLHRWAHHVSDWIDLAQTSDRVIVVTYAGLKDDYAGTIGRWARLLGSLPTDLTPPSAFENVVAGKKLPYSPDDRALLEKAAAEQVGEVMRKLGYLA